MDKMKSAHETEANEARSALFKGQPVPVTSDTAHCLQRQSQKGDSAQQQFRKLGAEALKKGISLDLSNLIDTLLRKGIKHDVSKEGLEGLKVSDVPILKVAQEIPRGIEFTKRLFRFDDHGRLSGLDIQGAIEIYKPRDPRERVRVEEKMRSLQEWQRLFQNPEERRMEEQLDQVVQAGSGSQNH